jgi:hypothetical protein
MTVLLPQGSGGQAWLRRACDRAFNLGLSIGELKRRVHGRTDDRQMVELALALEETLRLDEERLEP